MTNPFDGNAAGPHGGSSDYGSADYGYGSNGTHDYGGFNAGTPGYDNSGFDNSGYGNSGYGDSGYGNYGQPGYPQPGGSMRVSPVDAMDSIGQAFQGFLKQPLPGILATLVHTIIITVVLLGGMIPLTFMTAPDTTSYGTTEPEFGAGAIATIVVLIVVMYAYIFWMVANYYVASVTIADGGKVSFGDYFSFNGRGGVALAYLCFTLAFLLGMVFFIIPGIILSVVFWPVPALKAQNPGMSIATCFGTSWNLVKQNFGQALLFIVVFTIVVGIVGSIPIIGGLAALPVMALGHLLFTRAMLRQPSMRWE